MIAFSPYRNGSYLVPTMEGSLEEYALYCSCRRAAVASLWRGSEVKSCEVSNAAYSRGYGTPDEIVPINRPQDAWSFDVSKYLNNAMEKRRDAR